jgi:hypothetical protein
VLKRDAVAIWPASRDLKAPWYTKVLAIAVAGYAFAPSDLIPDLLPVLGYLRSNRSAAPRFVDGIVDPKGCCKSLCLNAV